MEQSPPCVSNWRSALLRNDTACISCRFHEDTVHFAPRISHGSSHNKYVAYRGLLFVPYHLFDRAVILTSADEGYGSMIFHSPDDEYRANECDYDARAASLALFRDTSNTITSRPEQKGRLEKNRVLSYVLLADRMDERSHRR